MYPTLLNSVKCPAYDSLYLHVLWRDLLTLIAKCASEWTHSEGHMTIEEKADETFRYAEARNGRCLLAHKHTLTFQRAHKQH